MRVAPEVRNTVPADAGAASLSIVLLSPLLVVLMFAGFQAALWNHANTQARVVARETAVLVARDGVDVSSAAAAARTSLAGSDLAAADVAVEMSGGRVIVTVAGSAPGILRGTSRGVAVTVVLPLEGWVPL